MGGLIGVRREEEEAIWSQRVDCVACVGVAACIRVEETIQAFLNREPLRTELMDPLVALCQTYYVG